MAVDWNVLPILRLKPGTIPPEVDVKGGLPNNQGRPSLTGPGAIENPNLNPYRKGRRFQELVFDMAAAPSREPREVVHSHLNYMVPDTKRWEQSAAFYIDNHSATAGFVKNAGLGFSIPYLHNGQMHDYIPDFIIKLKGTPEAHLILETKGYDPSTEVKRHAADRWVAAVNADGTYGRWMYALAMKPEEVGALIASAVEKVASA
jgi:hypothetical protein